MAATRPYNSWNSPILLGFLLVYAGLLMLFGWQTWQFVSWLFPADQLIFKILTLFSFDILAALWAIAHTFYRFASRGAKKWVQIAWGLTFFLSLVASVLYLVIQAYFRFHLSLAPETVNFSYAITIFALVASVLYLVIQAYFRFHLSLAPETVNFSYAITIFALVFNILAVMAFLILEWQARHPRQDEFDIYENQEALPAPASHVDFESMIDAALERRTTTGSMAAITGPSSKNGKSPR